MDRAGPDLLHNQGEAKAAPSPLIDTLIRMRREKDTRKGWKRKRADRKHLTLPYWQDQGYEGRLFWGDCSVTLESSRTKWVGRNADYYPYTAGELAKELLSLFRMHHRRRFSKWELRQLSVKPALYWCGRPQNGRWDYVDFSAAYWNASIKYPWNISHFESTDTDRVMGDPEFIPDEYRDEIRREKALRLALWGITSCRYVRWFQFPEGKSTQYDIGTRFSKPGLTYLVMRDVKKAARVAVEEYNAHMFLTDAAIVPQGLGNHLINHLEWLGFPARIVASGSGRLNGLGSYRVGNKASLDVIHKRQIDTERSIDLLT